MPQPSVSGMDPPFGDAFRSHTFSEQTLMSTDLLANSSDPDFMYELDREMNYQQNPRDNFLSLEDCKDIENLESFTDVLDNEDALTSNWEQWDTYCEDLTKYTKLTSCDIWGTKEVDYLGLDDFSSPYQDEEVISKTPTLAQLNSEDSQSVSDSLYYPDSLFSVKQNPLPPSFPSKKITSRAAAPVCSSKTLQAEVPSSDCVQKASKPTSSTQIMVKTNMYHNEKVNFHVECKDYVKKAKVKINLVQQGRPLLSQAHTDAAKENTCYCGAVARRQEKRGVEPHQGHGTPALPFRETQELLLSPLPQGGPGSIATAESGSLSASTSVSDSSQKKEEHNYSLFVSDNMRELPTKCSLEDDEDDEDDIDDEDHDEGFGSEHELSENEEEEEEEEDYEDDRDDDISDTFSEPGYENDSVEDLKEMTSVSSRKRGKRRYFWEYSEQLTPSQQERILRPSEWNRDTLPSNMYQKNGLHHGKYAVKKSRRTDVEDLTPNPKKLLQIGNELRKLNKVISDLTPVSELPLTARPRSRKEKNKLASRACRLKKKAQYEANKVKLWGLNTEYDNLLFVINSIKQDIVNRVQNPREERGPSMGQKLEILIKDTLVGADERGCACSTCQGKFHVWADNLVCSAPDFPVPRSDKYGRRAGATRTRSSLAPVARHSRVSNMAAPQDVHVRICNQEIVRFDLEVKALIQDIRDCSGPLSELTELNTKVKEKFQQLRHRIQELEQSAREQDKESEKQLLLQEVENHKKQMLSNQTSWRKANLTCKIAIDNLEKAELLQGGDPLRQRKTTKESLAQTSSTITESLMGISRMMSQQVQQSEEAMQTLVSSSRTLLDANEEFKSMSGTIQLGRKLITKYNRRELTDKLLIFLALALFLATVLYIVKKRLFPFL